MIVSIVVALAVLAPLIAIVVGGAKVKGTVPCPADEWTPVIKNFGTAFPRSILLEAAGDGVEIKGRWREVRQRAVFRDLAVAGELEPSLVFHRRWIDWRYRIEVRPDADIIVTLS